MKHPTQTQSKNNLIFEGVPAPTPTYHDHLHRKRLTTALMMCTVQQRLDHFPT